MLSTGVGQPHPDKTQTANKPKNILTTVIYRVKHSAKFTIFCIIQLFYYFLYTYGIIPRPPEPITISSQSDEYIQLQKTRFLESYTRFSYDDINTNVDKCFYDRKLHAVAVENQDNELENTWKRRILFENTPRGTVIMHYDAYKQGFVYYSDGSNIPYFVINAVIMKYVITFRCRDFFMDDQFTLDHSPSPLFSVYNTTESDTTISTTANKPSAPPIKSNAFAKLKNYNTVSAKLTKSADTADTADKPVETQKYTRNKIIYSGKICNFHLLQKTPTKRVKFASTLADELQKNSSVQSQVFTYKDFKKMQQLQATTKS